MQGRLKRLLGASASSCVLFGTADAVAQILGEGPSSLCNWKERQFDWERTGFFALVGATLHGPVGGFGSRLIQRRLGAARDPNDAYVRWVFQTAWFPAHTVLTLAYLSLLEGKDAGVMWQKTGIVFTEIRKSFAGLYSSLQSTPMQDVRALLFYGTLLIAFLPFYRPLGFVVQEVTWNSILSGWNAHANRRVRDGQ